MQEKATAVDIEDIYLLAHTTATIWRYTDNEYEASNPKIPWQISLQVLMHWQLHCKLNKNYTQAFRSTVQLTSRHFHI